MAKTSVPDPLQRRHLLEEELDANRARQVGEAYVAEGRACEAVAFFERAEARDALESLRDTAVSEGDLFLFRSVITALGEEPSADLWSKLAHAAEAAGKDAYAAEARRQAERG